MSIHSIPLTWVVPGKVAAMAKPMPAEIARLPALGVTALLSLTEEARRIGASAKRHGLDWLHIPLEDFGVPTLDEVRQGVGFMAYHIDQGGAVLVHCRAGLGRTGTMIACYLVLTGVAPSQAITLVRRARPGSVETVEQEALVHHWSEYLRSGNLR